MKQKIKKLGKKELQEIILQMMDFLSEEQSKRLETLVDQYAAGDKETEAEPVVERMSQAFVEEKMGQLKIWMEQIDEGELYLEVDEYEDYSGGYWDRDWITEYHDSQRIGDKIMTAIQFAKDCVDDRRYQEASLIYEWLWEMCVSTDSEYDGDPADFETLAEEKIISVNMEQLALLTLYTDYQVREPDKRAEDIYLYFCYGTFRKLHIQDMFRVGRENLTGEEQFWKDWIALLKTKSGDEEGRLLKEAVLYTGGMSELVKMADDNCQVHPSLYLDVMKDCEKNHDYVMMEQIGEKALDRINVGLIIRSRAALMASSASAFLKHQEKVMLFCWESFRSDSTDRNFLRLFGMKEMAKRYGMRGKEVLRAAMRGNGSGISQSAELAKNMIGDYGYYTLSFYNGDFKLVKEASKNPKGSLGWSTCFIRYGIQLFLLYLYDKQLPSKAASDVARGIGFQDDAKADYVLPFESEIAEESRKFQTSVFWNYFQRWKQYFGMEEEDRKAYLKWAEKIVQSRADAIVGGQHRGHYGEVAMLLGMVAEIKESMGEKAARQEIFAEYKRKFPRHSSFQAEMKTYFGKW